MAYSLPAGLPGSTWTPGSTAVAVPVAPRTSAATIAPHRHNRFECSTTTRPGRYPHRSRTCVLPGYAVAIARLRPLFLLAVAVLVLVAAAPVQAHFSGRKAI